MDDLLRVGVVSTTHGVHGEMKIFPTTEDPSRFSDLKEVIAQTKKGQVVWPIEQVRYFRQFVLLKIKGIDDCDQAAVYRGTELYVTRDQAIPLKEDEYFISDIIGLEVVTDAGEKFGVVQDVLQTGANDVYEILPYGAKKTVLFPAIKQCILAVDLEAHTMTVHIMDGLLE